MWHKQIKGQISKYISCILVREMETLEESPMRRYESNRDEKQMWRPEVKFVSLALGGWWMCGHLTERDTSDINSNCWRREATLWFALQLAPLSAAVAAWPVNGSQIRLVCAMPS